MFLMLTCMHVHAHILTVVLICAEMFSDGSEDEMCKDEGREQSVGVESEINPAVLSASSVEMLVEAHNLRLMIEQHRGGFMHQLHGEPVSLCTLWFGASDT